MFVTVLIHAVLLLTIPERFITVDPSAWKSAAPQSQYKIHMVREDEPPPQPPDQYVQATDAPENKPDDTTNFSSKDQQASQKIESKDKTGDMPEVEDGKEEDSNALQSGLRGQPATMQELVEDSKNDTQNPQRRDQQQKQEEQQAEGQREKQNEKPTPPAPAAIAEQNPQSGGQGYAEIFKPGKKEEIPEKAPDEREIPAVITNPFVRMEQPKSDPSDPSGMKPQPRPRLTLPGAMPTLVRKSVSGLATPNGFLAFDSKLSEYGDYLSRMFEVIGTKWNDLNRGGQIVVGDSRVFVRISFFITHDGQIEDLRILESNASQIAQWRCKDAILSNAPYFEWTSDMVKVLGERTEVKVQFFY
jgi:hypothetical protein